MTATEEKLAITEPGIYPDMPEDAYHADPVPGGSLSASGAKLLLPPSCPARYRYERMFGRPPKAEFDFGTAAHRSVLGAGMPVCALKYADWRTKAAQQARDEAREQGYIPVLAHEQQQILAMAAAIRAHPIAGPLLDPEYGGGEAEQSLFWTDDDTGIWRRARLDWLPTPDPRRRLIIADYKTTADASTPAIRKAIGNYRYHIQAAQYTDGIRALGLDDDPAFVFVFQEKTPPYLVNVADLGDEDIAAGREQMRAACEIWRDCTASGIWPGYSDYDITHITLPPWAARTEGDLYS